MSEVVQENQQNQHTEQVATTDQVAMVESSVKYVRKFTGRTMITSPVDAVTADNVIDVVEAALRIHEKNRSDIDYLWNYFKGDQPVYDRTRELRPELTEYICENRANEIVTFKVGYQFAEPIQYVSARNDSPSESIVHLNDAMRVIGKHNIDKEMGKWLYIGGICCRLVEQNRHPLMKIPFMLYTLDPRTSFVIHSSDHTKRSLAGVFYTMNEQNEKIFSVFTDDSLYKWKQGDKTATRQPNAFGAIPIIEYRANMERQGCIEIVISLLDAINNFDCDRLEAVSQFVQSLLVLYNCQIEEGKTANDIRKAGLIILKSINQGEKADVKNLSEQLDQTQNQSLKDDLLRAVHEIVGMPSQSDGNTGDSSNNGAVLLKNGWEGAETRAKDFESEFSAPEMEMLWLLSKICGDVSEKNGGFKFSPLDIDIKMPRHNYDNLLSKSQTLTTMLGCDKIDPKYAYEACGLFPDVEEAHKAGIEWFQKMTELQAKLEKAKAEREISQQQNQQPKQQEQDVTPNE